MTEEEWLSCREPQLMVEFLGKRLSERKHRLFACACVRRLWEHLANPRSRQAVEVAERYADGQATVEELNAAWGAAGEAFDASPGYLEEAAWGTADTVNQYLDSASLILAGLREDGSLDGGIPSEWREEQEAQCELLRELVGNPFRPVSFDPSWRTLSVLSLAARVGEGAFEAVPILADAVEEAGCTDEAILGHLRGPGPLVRGCWVVDLLLETQ